MLDAAQLALFDVGAEQLVLLPYDTAGTTEGAARAARAAIADGAKLILGPVYSGSVAAVAPIALAAGINVVAFSSDRAVARPGVFVMGLLPEEQVARVVAVAVGAGHQRFAALVPASSYGQAVVKALRAAVAEARATLTDVVFYPADAAGAADVADIVRVFTDYDARRAALVAQRRRLKARADEVSREALRRLEGRDTLGEVNFDAVLLPEGGPRLITVAALLPFYDVDVRKVRLLGTALWETAPVTEEPALVGGWYAAPPKARTAAFAARFAKAFGRGPPALATLAYDAIALAGALAKQPEGANFSARMLSAPGGFRGLDGIFRFTAEGLNERGLSIYEVTADGVVEKIPAPESFAGF